MQRRDFIKTMAVGIGAASSLPITAKGLASNEEDGKLIPKRPYGKTGIELSIIGLGGIVVTRMPQKQANEIVSQAIDRGVNYVDVAPTYGNAEDVLGIALRGYRDKIFLACKTNKRKKDEAAAELRQSLKKLNTDHFDLYQLHAVTTEEEVDTILAPGGALEAFIEAREQGLVRYLGFSAHSVEAASRLLDEFEFDSILFPTNFVLYFKERFGPQVIEKAKEKGVARLALKAMAKSKWPKDADRGDYTKCWYMPASEPRLASMALRFTLSQPITAAIPPGAEKLFLLALDIAANYTPITESEIEELKKIAQKQDAIFQLQA